MGRHATPEELGMATEAMVTHSGTETEVDLTDEAPEIEIEVIDDRPAEDQRPPAAASTKTEELTDEEVKELGGRAEKRISKLTWERHEERRAKETAERERDEAVSFAERTMAESGRNKKLLERTQAALNDQAVKRAEGAIRAAEQRLVTAHETGDVKQIASATQDLTNATVAKTHAPSVARGVQQKWDSEEPEPEVPAKEPAKEVEVPEPSKKAMEWSTNNEWFGKDRIMTGVAYGIHEELVIEHGIHPDSDEYWEMLDAGLRKELPHRFETSSTDAPNVSQPVATGHVDTVVAPATRNNGAKAPQKIQLTETQVALAGRLGLTLKQYAKELVKEQSNV